MPQVELKYSDDLKINPNHIFDLIEEIINKIDPSSGECKSRAYPAPFYKHTHMLITIAMLEKPHRNEAFSDDLMVALVTDIKGCIPKGAHFSLSLNYNLKNYITRSNT